MTKGVTQTPDERAVMDRNVPKIANDVPAGRSSSSDREPVMRLTPRQFIVIVGAVLLFAGFLALALPISGDYQSDIFGSQSVDCGAALGTDMDLYSGEPLEACQDAVSTRRAWGWPLTALGVLVVAGGLLVQSPKRETAAD